MIFIKRDTDRQTDRPTELYNPTDAIASKNLLMLIPLLALFYVALHNILCEVKLK